VLDQKVKWKCTVSTVLKLRTNVYALQDADGNANMLENKGLGDTIEMITKVTGIKAAVGAISELVNVPCGCQERKEKLNKLFPYETSK
jgi:hypothetical protein